MVISDTTQTFLLNLKKNSMKLIYIAKKMQIKKSEFLKSFYYFLPSSLEDCVAACR